jgi:hypothetical protein
MNEASAIVNYLLNCYRADNRQQGLLNYFSQKTEHRLLLTDAALLTDELPLYPVDPDWGEAVEKTLTVYQKEKELQLSYLFVTGQSEDRPDHTSSTPVTPLFLIPAQLERRNELFFVRIDAEQATVNPLVLSRLPQSEKAASPAEALTNWVTQGSYLFGRIGELRRLLERVCPTLSVHELLMYPALLDRKTIRGQQSATGLRLLPAAGLGVVRKSTATLGVLSELEELSDTNDYSSALSAFLGASSGTSSRSTPPAPVVPAVLSAAQQNAFAATQYPLSQLTGPPGTGKSFLIAALAIDAMRRGESVLITAANEQAVEVIFHKIQQDFQLEQTAVRGGGTQDHQRQLKKRLDDYLSGVGLKAVMLTDLSQQEATVRQRQGQLIQLATRYQQAVRRARRRGAFLVDYAQKRAWWQRIQHYFLGRQLSEEQPLSDKLLAYQQTLHQYHEATRKLLHDSYYYQLGQTLQHHRREVQQLVAGLRARTRGKQDRLFGQVNFRQIHQAFPVWLVPVTQLSDVLPLQRELFDLLIVDEATQCDAAAVLPALQRSRRAVVAGDPQQLRHVSFLAASRQQTLAHEAGLSSEQATLYDYRRASALDVVNHRLASQAAVTFLNEHYRSQPAIIDFSNRRFYGGQLRVMTTHPHAHRAAPLQLRRVDGHRDRNGVNEVEAAWIMDQIVLLTEKETKLDPSACQSIGILSPYRAQVDYLQQLVSERLSTAVLQRHRLLVGTPYSFQGEERDLMFLSLSVDHQTHPSAFQHLARTDVFNVSITRARAEQWVVTSLHKPTGYAAAELLESYLAHCTSPPSEAAGQPSTTYRDEFLHSVTDWLTRQGITDWYPGYAMAGVVVDIILVHQQHTYGIQLVGYPGDLDAALTIEECNRLERIQVPVFPVTYAEWQLQPERCQQQLASFLEIAGD